MILLFLLGCPKVAPAVYPVPAPAMVEPAALEWTAAPDDCPTVQPVTPGTTPSFLLDGEPTCRGLLVPEAEHAYLLHQETLAEYWAPRALLCQDGRDRDRAHGQAMFAESWQGSQALKREIVGLRVGGAAVAVGALMVGAGIGVAAAKVGAF